jgi:hypothetical protein
VSTGWPWYVQAVRASLSSLHYRGRMAPVYRGNADAVPSLWQYSLNDGCTTPCSPVSGVRTSGTDVRSRYKCINCTYVPLHTYVVLQYRMVPHEKKNIPRIVRTYVPEYWYTSMAT